MTEMIDMDELDDVPRTEVTMRGEVMHVSGELPSAGGPIPGFRLVNGKLQDVTEVQFEGVYTVLYIVPSVETPVCASSTKHLDELADAHPDVAVLVVSADLPFAQSRFCRTEKLKHVQTLSTMRDGVDDQYFAEEYGVLLEDGPLAGLSARALMVFDRENMIVYSELVSELTDVPDFDAAFATVK